MKSRAFTLVELVVISTIILVLGSVAITQGVRTQRSLAFNAAFDRIVQAAQKARSLATTQGGEEAKTYTAKVINNTSVRSLQLLENNGTALEATYNFPAYITVKTYRDSLGTLCTTGDVEFSAPNGDIVLRCDSTNSYDTPEFKKLIVIAELPSQNSKKAFVIHRATGIPQVVDASTVQ